MSWGAYLQGRLIGPVSPGPVFPGPVPAGPGHPGRLGVGLAFNDFAIKILGALVSQALQDLGLFHEIVGPGNLPIQLRQGLHGLRVTVFVPAGLHQEPEISRPVRGVGGNPLADGLDPLVLAPHQVDAGHLQGRGRIIRLVLQVF